jgi:hypothetical protein
MTSRGVEDERVRGQGFGAPQRGCWPRADAGAREALRAWRAWRGRASFDL